MSLSGERFQQFICSACSDPCYAPTLKSRVQETVAFDHPQMSMTAASTITLDASHTELIVLSQD